jgi:hypothetical protein
VSTRKCINCEDRELKARPRSFGLLKCKHYWCQRCLHQKCIVSLINPDTMPPRCCNEPIRLVYVEHLFDKKFRHLWHRKWFESLVKNPAYCPHSTCGALIYPGGLKTIKQRDPSTMIFPYSNIKRIWSCIHCGKRMCVSCNGEPHSSDRPCVSEKIRARNARFYSRSGPQATSEQVVEIVARNRYEKYTKKRRRIPAALRLDERRNRFWKTLASTFK